MYLPLSSFLYEAESIERTTGFSITIAADFELSSDPQALSVPIARIATAAIITFFMVTTFY
jgi:hypothetical protein